MAKWPYDNMFKKRKRAFSGQATAPVAYVLQRTVTINLGKISASEHIPAESGKS